MPNSRSDSMSVLRSSISSRIFKLPNFATIAYRWLFPDSQVSVKTLCSAVIDFPKFCCSRYGFTCASLAWSPSSSGPPVFRNIGLSGSGCEFFSCYTFPRGHSSGNGSPRACSSSCDWVCNRSPCACSRIFWLPYCCWTLKIFIIITMLET